METTNSKALKAGFWYILCNFMSKGIYMITTPVFTRILTTEDYGMTANYSSWLSLLAVVCTLDLNSCIQLAKVKYDDEAGSRRFLSSITFLSSCSVIVFYVLVKIVLLFYPSIFGMPQILVDILFAEILFKNVYTLLQVYHKAYFRYKEFTVLTFITTISGQMLAVFLVLHNAAEGYLNRILGTAIPTILVGVILFLYILLQGKKLFDRKKWEFGVRISVPLIPHHLSGDLLAHSDRIIINWCVGASAAALYSVASNYALMMQVVWSSFNGAWTPWFYDKMKKNKIDEIYRYSQYYTVLFAVITVLAVLFGPEAIWILGGTKYADATNVIPPIVLGVLFQFMYSFYANIEFYYQKTTNIAKWTVVAACVNVVLNFILIPIFGYVAAGYTTLLGYVLLLILHYKTAKKMEQRALYNKRFLLFTMGGVVLCVAVSYMLYDFLWVRIGLGLALLCGVVYKCRIVLITIVSQFISKVRKK